MTVEFDIGNRGVENIAVAIKRIYPVVSVECRYIFFVDTVGGVVNVSVYRFPKASVNSSNIFSIL